MRQKRDQFKTLFYYLLALSLILLSTNAFAVIVNVPTAEHATIQAGIDAANPGDTVLVANGNYTGPGNRNLDFGGKAITVKSVGGPQACTIDVEGSDSNQGRGFYFHSSEGRNSVLSGFTITGGYFELGYGSGGGIFIDTNSSPTVINCTVRQNDASAGGGIFSLGAPEILNCIIENNHGMGPGGIHSSGPAIIKECIIRNNRSGSGAGGIYASGGTTIFNCSIIGNVTLMGKGSGLSISGAADVIDCSIDGNFQDGDSWGGGISLSNSTANIINSTISHNGCYFGGGGIYMGGSSPNITGCNIIRNGAAANGGGIFMAGSSPVISKCNISNNYADASDGLGGGIYIVSSSPRIENSNIIGNRAHSSGTGIYITDTYWGEIGEPSYPVIINCTFSRNKPNGEYNLSTIAVNSGSTLTLTNSILWGNLDKYGNQGIEISGDFELNLITNNNINQDGFEGINYNIRQDPLFVDPDNGDFHLSAGSPCIDAASGNNAPDTDIDGDPRPRNWWWDMGADEFLGCLMPVGDNKYCWGCGPCAEGAGDCDNDSECEAGLTCVQVTGTDTCQASTPVCPHPVGHLDFCRDCGPCTEGEGDCDTDGECQSGLTCAQVPGTDTCQASMPVCPYPVGHLDYCKDCGPCAVDQGDCDKDSECSIGLTCVQIPGTDTCQASPPVCPHLLGHLDYCQDCGPCAAGQGDCDNDSECQSGLNCVQVVGTDVCCSHPIGHLDYCRDCGPCAAGQGDCDNDGECQSGLICSQVPGVDWCQAP